MQQIHLNIQLAPEKALTLPPGAQSIFGECCGVFAVVTAADVLSKAATRKELNTRPLFSLECPVNSTSASQWMRSSWA